MTGGRRTESIYWVLEEEHRGHWRGDYTLERRSQTESRD